MFKGEILKVFEQDENITCSVFYECNHEIMCNMDLRTVLITSCCIANPSTLIPLTGVSKPFHYVHRFPGLEFGQCTEQMAHLCSMRSGTSARVTQTAGGWNHLQASSLPCGYWAGMSQRQVSSRAVD